MGGWIAESDYFETLYQDAVRRGRRWDICRYRHRLNKIDEEMIRQDKTFRDIVIARWNEEDPLWKVKLVAMGRDIDDPKK